MQKLCIAIVFFFTTLLAFADSQAFFLDVISRETLAIQQTPSYDYKALSDAYSSRGESYFVLNDELHALEDFLIAHEYALRAKEEDQDIL